uniref:LRRCT domain-containing protein n=1 Tax=Branchiostoma floridae TaxID=7739 RepID=C3ZK19_BRAFL|eukprot:XP_002591106.1 hypothetical protein BRAFLDRAFT_108716 [Branchiostoma floridae]
MGPLRTAVGALLCLLSAVPCCVTRDSLCFPGCSERSWHACIPESLTTTTHPSTHTIWRSPSGKSACFLCNKQRFVAWMPPENVTCIPSKTGSIKIAVRGYHFGSLSARKLGFVDPGTTALSLIDNNITKLETNALARLTRLYTLHLDFNKLSGIKAGWFGGLGGLEILTLTNNQIKTIEPGSFQDVRILKTLFLENNLVQSLHPDSLLGLGSLWDLYLGRSRLSAFPSAALRGLRHLVRLDLHGSRLAGLDGRVLTGLGRLENVKVDGTRLATLDGGTLENTSWGVTLEVRQVRSPSQGTVRKHVQSVSVSVHGVLVCLRHDDVSGVTHLGWMFAPPVIPFCRADLACRCSALDRDLTRTTGRLPAVIVIPTGGASRQRAPDGHSLYGRALRSLYGVRLPLRHGLALTLVGVDATDDTVESSAIVIDHADNQTIKAPGRDVNTYLLVPNAEQTVELTLTPVPLAVKTTQEPPNGTEPNASPPLGVFKTTTQQAILSDTASDHAPVPLGVLIVIIVALVMMPSMVFLLVTMLRRHLRGNVVRNPQNRQNNSAHCAGTGTGTAACSTCPGPAHRQRAQFSQPTGDGVSTITDPNPCQVEYRVYWGISDSGAPTVSVSRVALSTTHDRLRPSSSLPHTYETVPDNAPTSSGQVEAARGQGREAAMVSAHRRTRPKSLPGDIRVRYENTAGGGNARTSVNHNGRVHEDQTVDESDSNEDHMNEDHTTSIAASVVVSLPRLTRTRHNRAVYGHSPSDNADRVLYGREGNPLNPYQNTPCSEAAVPRLARTGHNSAAYRVSQSDSTDRVLYGREGNPQNQYQNTPCSEAVASPMYADSSASHLPEHMMPTDPSTATHGRTTSAHVHTTSAHGRTTSAHVRPVLLFSLQGRPVRRARSLQNIAICLINHLTDT